MSRPCLICLRPDRDAVEEALSAGESGRAVARRFGLSEAAVRRHRQNHATKLGEDPMTEEEKTRLDRLEALRKMDERIAEVEEAQQRLAHGSLDLNTKHEIRGQLQSKGVEVADDEALAHQLSHQLVGLRDYREQLALRAGSEPSKPTDALAGAKEAERKALEILREKEPRRTELVHDVVVEGREDLRDELAAVEAEIREAEVERERIALAVEEHERREEQRKREEDLQGPLRTRVVGQGVV